MFQSIASISIGAATGATLRWLLGLWLPAQANWPALGTLAANFGGAYLIGISAALFSLFPSSNPNLKLLLITGFLGSFTTFSAFSLEVVQMLQAQRLLQAALTISLHVFGSVLLTALGLWTVSAVRSILQA
ncbi:fluoride efflux transporter CrcB [Neisseria weaveri]|uniref:fluoride efflux transporter CrcB n=1 Tax=Neisseria weaveri TaxID=28091 RepID=UPI000D301062|nr:fluoride efflux transporter CrcB [Neisseria weaveri]